jgi:branched-chain amino acid transport system substrate-binding protein
MKVTRLVLGLGLSALLATTACGSSSSSSAASGGSSTIKLGAWLPLSGTFASVGIPQKAGADAYFKQTNDAGGVNGRKIEWITEDNAFDSQQTIQVARKMVQQNKVVAFVAPTGTAATQAAWSYVLHQAKVPIAFTYGGLASWYDPVQPLLFGSQTLYQSQAQAIGAWAVEDGHKKIVVLHDDPAAYQTVADAVAPAVKAKDPSVSVQQVSVKSGTTDYTPIVSQIKGLNPDAVILITPYPEAAAYLKAAKQQGLKAQPYGYTPATDTGMVKLAGSAAEGFKGVNLTKPLSDTSPAMQEFKTAMAKYEPGVEPTFNSLITYAEAKAFVLMLGKITGPITSDAITKGLENAGSIDTGLLAPLSFSATKHLGTNEVQRMVVKNGQFVGVGSFYAPPPVS